ncbi:MAG: hypothetical protein ACJ763_07640 [Bdellovibrionia bacterium]
MSFSLVATYSAFAQDDASVSTDNQAGISANDQGNVTNDQNQSDQQNAGLQSSDMQSNQAGTTADNTGVSVAPAPEANKKKTLVDEKIGLKPQLGVVNYRDASNAKSNRALYGATIDFNMAGFVNKEMDTEHLTGLFIGPQTGFLYSHIGAVGGGFFGESGAQGGTPGVPNSNAGANMFLLPANLKAGWTAYGFRLSAHGGGNVIYRSAANSILVGVNTPNTPNSKWGILPDAGAELEYGVLNGGAILVRSDWTFGGSNTMFTGTVGYSMPLG